MYYYLHLGYDRILSMSYDDRKNLIKKIGIKKVEQLEKMRNDIHKWDRADLNYIIKTYSLNSKTNGTNHHLPF